MNDNNSLNRYLASRRSFLKKAGLLTGAGFILPSTVLTSHSGTVDTNGIPAVHSGRDNSAGSMVRIRGHVISDGSGVRDVVVTDGLRVTQTNDEGEYELVSDGRRPFVYLSLPSGYRIPTNPTGTAHFYKKITPDSNGEMTARFQLEPRRNSEDHHRFLLLADPQTENNYEVERFHSETVPDIQQLIRSFGDGQPIFGFGCGDLMFDNLELFPEYEVAVKKSGVPFFQVLGNHDIVFDVPSTEKSYKVFHEYFGPSHYSFDMGEVHYIVLNNIFWHGAGYIGYLGRDQLDWLKANLARVESGRTVIVTMHIPAESKQYARFGQGTPSTHISVTNRHELYRLLEPYNAHILSGHTHEHEHVFEGGVHEHIHGTVCGAWWSGPICFDGTPNGYGVYEVRGSELRWQYKSTGKAHDHQIRLYKHGTDPEAADEIVANVWDWDPEWNVFWYENGERRGRMKRKTGPDPLSVKLHDGSDKPERRTWVNPVPNDHMFYAPAARNNGDIVVEAVNRFGKAFKTHLRQ